MTKKENDFFLNRNKLPGAMMTDERVIDSVLESEKKLRRG